MKGILRITFWNIQNNPTSNNCNDSSTWSEDQITLSTPHSWQLQHIPTLLMEYLPDYKPNNFMSCKNNSVRSFF